MRWTGKRICEKVEQLLRDQSINEPPVPVDRLARHLGAQLRYEPSRAELSGMLFRDKEHIIIGVNALHPKTRQRFTIAHELGHLMLHKDDVRVDQNFRVQHRDELAGQAMDADEIAANTFAAELLMPASMLRRELIGHAVDYEDDELLRRLANKYNVSLQAMIFRLTNLGLVNQAVDPPL